MKLSAALLPKNGTSEILKASTTVRVEWITFEFATQLDGHESGCKDFTYKLIETLNAIE